MTGGGDAVTHSEFFETLDSGVEGGGVVAVLGTNIVGAKNGEEQAKLTLVEESGNGSREGGGIDGQASRRRGSDQEGKGVREDGIERRLGVEKIQSAEI
jgi:hypothetical protein